MVNGVTRPKLSIFLITLVFFGQKRKRLHNIMSPSKKKESKTKITSTQFCPFDNLLWRASARWPSLLTAYEMPLAHLSGQNNRNMHLHNKKFYFFSVLP